MKDPIFVALDDWQIVCRNLDELVATIAEISTRPYVAASLLAELQLVVQCEVDDWNKLRFFFDSRDAAEKAYYDECKRRNIKS